jgi:hypothetical protein
VGGAAKLRAMSSISPHSLAPAWAAAVSEAALRPGGPATTAASSDAARWFDGGLESAELLRAPAAGGVGDSAARLSERFLGSLLEPASA